MKNSRSTVETMEQRHPRPLLVRCLILLVALASTMFMSVATAGPASAAPPAPTVSLPVTGSTSTGLPVTGTLDITKFASSSGQLVALGTFNGTVGSQTVTQAIAAPVQVAQANCQILNLVLGPLDLNLLGLVIHLDTVHLNITAQQGPGNLLGNLLCAVAGLLDGPSPLSGLAALLNRILAILG